MTACDGVRMERSLFQAADVSLPFGSAAPDLVASHLSATRCQAGDQRLRKDNAMVSRGIQATALAVLFMTGSLGVATAQVRGGSAGTLQGGNLAGTLRGNLAGTLSGNPAGTLRGNPAGTLGGNSAATMNRASPGGTTLQAPNSNALDNPPNGE
jgi:hypothetical protein